MMKKVGCCFLVFCVMLLAGCAKGDVMLEINRFGGAQLEARIVTVPLLVSQLNSLKKDFAADGFQVEPLTDGKMEGFAASRSFTQLRELNDVKVLRGYDLTRSQTQESKQDLPDKAKQSTVIVNSGLLFDTVKFAANFDLQGDSDSSSLRESGWVRDNLLSQVKLNFVLKLPAAADSSNAARTAEDGRMLAWDIYLGEENPLQVQVTYLNPYKAAGWSLVVLLASSLAVGMLAGCGGKKEDAKSDVIKIGVFEPLTGDNAAGGELELRGIKLANKLHPEVLGKKVELVIADNKSDKAEAASVAARLIEKDKVKVIIGTYGSSLAMAAGNIVKENKIPAIGTSCTNPQVTANNDYYFRACFIDPFQGTVMANYAYNKGIRKVAIIQEVSNDYAVGLAKFFKEAFIKLTGSPDSVLEIANYQTGDKDFSAILTNIKAQNPDAVFAPGNFTESALLIKQARQLGLDVPFMGGDTWETQEFIDVGGKDVEGVALSTAFDREKATTAEAKKFLDAYVQEYNGEPSALTALAYDAYLIAIDGIKRAGTADDSVKIRDAIAQTKDLETVTGLTTLDANGDAIKAAIIKTVQDGKFKFLDFVDVK